MSNELEKKIQKVLSRWPKLKGKIKKNYANQATVTGDTPEKVLVHKGIHISSAFDPIKEAKVQASGLSEHDKVIWIYGVGSGYLIDEVLKTSTVQKVHVVFFNFRLLVESLSIYPHDWVNDKRVDLYFGSEKKYPTKPFSCVYAELELAEKSTYPLRDRVIMELDDSLRATQLKQRREFYDSKNIDDNWDSITADSDVSTYFNSYHGGLVVVAAGGETLDEFIKKPVKCDCLIAVSTALKPLLKANIVPDFVVVLDSHTNMVSHFTDVSSDVNLENSCLVYAPSVNPAIIDEWRGKRCVFSTQSITKAFSKLRNRHTELFCSGIVTHSAVDFAVKLGAAKVLMAGADFGYCSGYTHAENASLRKKTITTHKVENFMGNEIATTPALLSYMRDMESYIRIKRSVRFYSHSKQGSRIEGVEYWEHEDV